MYHLYGAFDELYIYFYVKVQKTHPLYLSSQLSDTCFDHFLFLFFHCLIFKKICTCEIGVGVTFFPLRCSVAYSLLSFFIRLFSHSPFALFFIFVLLVYFPLWFASCLSIPQSLAELIT